jgi:hypothetical protein
MDSFAETSDSESIDPELVAESTEPQYAPERRAMPVDPSSSSFQAGTPSAKQPATNERSRRPTLASPIPALMAASMRMQGPDADGNSGASLAPSNVVEEAVPMLAEPQMTSKLGEHTKAVLLQGESDYVVEIEDTRTDLEPDTSAVPVEHDMEDTNSDP